MKKELFSKFVAVPEEKLGTIFTSEDATESSNFVVDTIYTADTVVRSITSDNLPRPWSGIGMYDEKGEGAFASPKSLVGVVRRNGKLVRVNEKALKGDLYKTIKDGKLRMKLVDRRDVEMDAYVDGKVSGTEMRSYLIWEVVQ